MSRVEIDGIAIETTIGDLTEEEIDAIVNAANSALARGGGVCGAIFAKAGPELDRYCASLGGCPTGEARLTPAFGLPQRGIIHAVGPRWRGGGCGEADLLASAWRSSLELADASGFRSVAFPSISTGIYGYPLDRAATVVAQALLDYAGLRAQRPGSVDLVRIVLRDESTRAIYDRAIREAELDAGSLAG
jgi:O-acetyl-ADP-ribose deacetylase (regulator of RNase III)